MSKTMISLPVFRAARSKMEFISELAYRGCIYDFGIRFCEIGGKIREANVLGITPECTIFTLKLDAFPGFHYFPMIDFVVFY